MKRGDSNGQKCLVDRLEANPIIAAIREESLLEVAIHSAVGTVFLLNTSLSNLEWMIRQVRERGKLVFVHLDMISGLSKDIDGLTYMRQTFSPDGIITTKSSLIDPAKHMGLYVIQRLFVLDSLSIQTGLKLAESHRPDLIEIMPGLIPKVIPELRQHCHVPMIAGGMIRTKEEVIDLLSVGAVAISTSNPTLWSIE